MFIYSIRASTVKLVGVMALALALVFGIVISGNANAISASSSATEIDFSGIKTNDSNFLLHSRRVEVKLNLRNIINMLVLGFFCLTAVTRAISGKEMAGCKATYYNT